MTQIINDVMIIKLEPADKDQTVIQQICRRYEQQIAENQLLRHELDRIKAEQKLLKFKNFG